MEPVQNQAQQVLDRLDPHQNHEEDKDEDGDGEIPLTEKDKTEAAYKSFKNKLESFMIMKIPKIFLKLSFDDMRL
jgi:hypothetical protein